MAIVLEKKKHAKQIVFILASSMGLRDHYSSKYPPIVQGLALEPLI